MFRFLSVFLAFFSLIFGAVLDKDLAFNISANSVLGGIEANIDFDKSVYIYADKLEIFVDDKKISPELPSPKQKEKSLIYESKFSVFIPEIALKNSNNLLIKFQGCSHSGFCYAPMSSAFKLDLKAQKLSLIYSNKVENSATLENSKLSENSENSKLLDDEQIADSFSKKGIFWLLASFFGYGVLLSLTPCVLPMLPILSAIIVSKANKGASKKATFLVSLEYVLALSLANSILGAIAGTLGSGVHGYLQNPIVIIISSIIFVILAFLMFSYARISSFLSGFNTAINLKAQAYSGHFGVIFMGFLSALVISPCVAVPLAGALLYIAKTGDMVLGGAALFVLSMGMSLPLLALGAGFSIAPKPGAWMDKITQIFAFVMMAMAIWLLSRIISEQISFLLYAILAIFTSVFLQDFKLNLSKIGKFFTALNIVLLSAGVAFLILAILEINGLKIINNLENSKSSKVLENSENSENSKENKKYLNNLNELESFIKTAKSPIIIDFWASWCVNCKDFEDEIKKDILAQNLLMGFEVAIVDLSQMDNQKEEILKKYELFGPPAFLFFKDGKLEKKIASAPQKDEFLKILKNFLENSPKIN